MSKINLDNQQAVILHQYDYRNSSLIINFFLSDYGKISVIAKGVKGSLSSQSKVKKNQRALFQPFQMLNVSLTGKSDLLNLKSIDLCSDTNKKWPLKGKALYCAYYINELLLRLLPAHTDCQTIFQYYLLLLDSLLDCSEQDKEKAHACYEITLRVFELNLLEHLGYGLNLIHEVSSGAEVQVSENYFYLIESGPSLVKVAGVKYLPISGSTLLNLSRQNFNDLQTLRESKQLLKWAISEHLGNKPLKSRELFKQLYC